MTPEEKAKAYDKAIEKIREGIQPLQDGSKISGVTKDFLEEVFPELKESEDERIRKAIIDFLWKEKIFLQEVHHSSVENNPKYRFVMKAIAWLEKQGEQSINDNKSIKPKFKLGDIISNGRVVYRVDNIVKNAIGQDCYFLVNVEAEKDGTRYLILTDSEGKTSHMGEITWLCEQVDKSFEKQDQVKISQHKNMWKPSDEQIKAIRLARIFVTDDFGEHPTLSEILVELENQLKKLKEE